jgi:hypothetical protein
MSYSSANPYVRVHSDNLNGQNFFSVLECDAAIFEKSCLTYLHMRRMREGHSGIPGESHPQRWRSPKLWVGRVPQDLAFHLTRQVVHLLAARGERFQHRMCRQLIQGRNMEVCWTKQLKSQCMSLLFQVLKLISEAEGLPLIQLIITFLCQCGLGLCGNSEVHIPFW